MAGGVSAPLRRASADPAPDSRGSHLGVRVGERAAEVVLARTRAGVAARRPVYLPVDAIGLCSASRPVAAAWGILCAGLAASRGWPAQAAR